VFVDVPRSRLVKYPLLLRTIQKHVSVNSTFSSRCFVSCCNIPHRLLAVHFHIISLATVMYFIVGCMNYCIFYVDHFYIIKREV